MKKSIRDFDLKGKRIIIRVDFNVPIKDKRILDDNRIRESLETIRYAINSNAKTILMSHLGRVTEEKDKHTKSLRIVSERLSQLLDKKVIFIDQTHGKKLNEAIKNLKNGEVLLIENTRFEDLNGSKESKNDDSLGKYWASLGDIFINDAFGTSHRSHASNVGISKYLPSGVGFLIERELNNIETIIKKPEKPFCVILGGAKVNDKIGVISNLVNVADYILIGGAMAYTFLFSEGYNVGKSLIDDSSIDFCKNILSKYDKKIILPIDTVVSNNIGFDIANVDINNISNDSIGLDIGKNTIDLFKKYLGNSKTVIWNGPLGMVENDKYVKGTREIAEFLSKTTAKVIIGGGDTAAIVINLGYKDKYTHISTGGGASLELLEGKVLPGIDIIQDK